MDALNAGLSRWKRLLFADFRLGMLLKLSFVALLAEVSGGGGFQGNYGNSSKGLDKMHGVPHAMHAAIITIIVGIVVLSFILGIVIFYLSCRMKFVEFHMAATGDRRVAPSWSWYRQHTWRLFWVTAGIDFAALLILAVSAIPLVIGFIHRGGFSGQPNLSLREVIALLLVVVPLLVAYGFALQFALMIVRDLMLPVWALENGTVEYSWQVARSIIERDIKAFVGYTFVKVLMHIAVTMASVATFVAAVLVSAIPFTAVGLAIYFPLHATAKVLMILLFVCEGLVGFAWLLVMICAVFGGSAWIFQCYAVEWVAGRYGPLAALMYPPPPPPPAPVLPPEPMPGPPPAPPEGGEGWVTVLG
jgi:hypothetical protein